MFSRTIFLVLGFSTILLTNGLSIASNKEVETKPDDDHFGSVTDLGNNEQTQPLFEMSDEENDPVVSLPREFNFSPPVEDDNDMSKAYMSKAFPDYKKDDDDRSSDLHRFLDSLKDDDSSNPFPAPKKDDDDDSSSPFPVSKKDDNDDSSYRPRLWTFMKRSDNDLSSSFSAPKKDDDDDLPNPFFTPKKEDDDDSTVIFLVPKKDDDDDSSHQFLVPKNDDDDDSSHQFLVPKNDDDDNIPPIFRFLNSLRKSMENSENICNDPKFDTIVTVKDNSTYIFKGPHFRQVHILGVAANTPLNISDHWPGLPNDLDASLTVDKDATYFFKGEKVWKFYNQIPAVGYPKLIREVFPGAPDSPNAAVQWTGNGKIYFFKDEQYWRFEQDNVPHVSDNYPKSIQEWAGLPRNITGAFRWINDKTYFFNEYRYYRFDDVNEQVDKRAWPLFPRGNAHWWLGCLNGMSDTVPEPGTIETFDTFLSGK